MTTLTNSEGTLITYTNGFIETILLQLNSSNNYYTTGDDEIIFVKIGSSKILILDYTYHINRNVFQHYAINENLINNYGLEFILNNTSNEYDLQSVYNGNSFIGIITELPQVFLALYDTNTNPQTYTESENIDITDNQISWNFPIKINDEVVLDPRLNGYFELYAGTSGFSFLQNFVDGAQPIAIFNSLNKSVEFFGDLDIPNYYNKTEVDAIGDELTASILNTYTKQEVDTLLTNTNLTGSGNIDITNNQISLSFPLKINEEIVINRRACGIQFEMYAATSGFAFLQNIVDGAQPIAIFNSLHKSVEFFGDLDIPNFYNEAEVDTLLSNVSLTNYYTKTQVDTLIYNINFSNNNYTKTETDTTRNDYATIIYLQDNYMTTLSIT